MQSAILSGKSVRPSNARIVSRQMHTSSHFRRSQRVSF